MQQLGPGRIAKETFEPKSAHELNGFQIVVEHGRFIARGEHQPIDHLPKTANPGDDDRMLFIDLVIGLFLRTFAELGAHIVMQHEEKRCEEQRERDHQQEPFCQEGIDHRLLKREGGQHHAELASLREGEGKEPLPTALEAKQAPKRKEHQPFGDHQRQGQRNDQDRVVQQHVEIDPRAHRDEEQAQ